MQSDVLCKLLPSTVCKFTDLHLPNYKNHWTQFVASKPTKQNP